MLRTVDARLECLPAHFAREVAGASLLVKFDGYGAFVIAEEALKSTGKAFTLLLGLRFAGRLALSLSMLVGMCENRRKSRTTVHTMLTVIGQTGELWLWVENELACREMYFGLCDAPADTE